MCGDRVQVWLKRDAGGRISDIGFQARGCAISIASADLMSEAVAGLDAAQVKELAAGFARMAATGTAPEGNTAMDTLKPLAGVYEFPSRVKCATLAWNALTAALDGAQETSSE
jgi:nitrogen fixation NifU-like protein